MNQKIAEFHFQGIEARFKLVFRFTVSPYLRVQSLNGGQKHAEENATEVICRAGLAAASQCLFFAVGSICGTTDTVYSSSVRMQMTPSDVESRRKQLSDLLAEHWEYTCAPIPDGLPSSEINASLASGLTFPKKRVRGH